MDRGVEMTKINQEEYEYKTGTFDWATALRRTFHGESEETEMKKDIVLLKYKLEGLQEINMRMREICEPNSEEQHHLNGSLEAIDKVLEIVDDLNESEVTLDKAFEKISESYPMTKEEIWRHLEQVVAHGGKVTYGEPEVLSQEWIDEHIDYADVGGDTSEIGRASCRERV